MYKKRSSLALRAETIKRVQLAAKFFDVYTYELLDVALDHFGIPRIDQEPTRRGAITRMSSHVENVDAGRKDALLADYFKRGIANDN